MLTNMDIFLSSRIDIKTIKYGSTKVAKVPKIYRKNQGVVVKHYSMPPAATKSKKLFLA